MILTPYVELCVIRYFETEIGFYGLYATRVFRVRPKNDSHYASEIKKEYRIQSHMLFQFLDFCNSKK
jgi:hypothetical protein